MINEAAIGAARALERLNREQRLAVETMGSVLVVAPPGSGKTSLLEAKAAQVLASSPNSTLLALTFTRDAAGELRERIKRLCGTAANRAVISTFHAIALLQLKRTHVEHRVISSAEQYVMMRRAWLETRGEAGTFENCVKSIESLKASGIQEIPDDPRGRLLRAYQKLLSEYNAWDYSDLMLRTVTQLRTGAMPLLAPSTVLVDEFQDTDQVQFEWLRCHSKIPMTVVGDDDQSIYSFRCALGYPGMVAFERQFNAVRVTLRANYRTHSEILSSAKDLISRNPVRAIKHPLAMRGAGGRIQCLGYHDRTTECEALARTIKETGGEWAVLARTNRLLNAVEAPLRSVDISYRRANGRSIWDNPSIGTYLSVLSAVARAADLGYGQLLYWIGLQESEIRTLRGAGTLSNALHGKDGTPGSLRGQMRQQVESVRIHLSEWEELHGQGRVEMVIHGVANFMLSFPRDDATKEYIRLAENALSKITGSLSRRLNVVQQKRETLADTPRVTLLTMHGSKGLEFDSVWIVAAEQRVTPHEHGDLAEERRLFYVAMTRARNRLIVSLSGEGPRMSQFLRESGLEVTWTRDTAAA